jgi:hypothetical protein
VLSRVCAVWLVTLILLPFSAPFSTCDASSLFASEAQSDETSSASPFDASTDTGASHALPVARPGLRVKLAVSATTTAIQLTPPSAPDRGRHDVASYAFVLAGLSPPLRL